MGYQVEELGNAGVVVCVGKAEKNTPVFLLRADMDALPVPEEADLEFASDNGNMHACGHDMHATMLLGAAKLLKNHEQELNGQVKLLFQAAEETLQGAKSAIENGALKKPSVDAALMIHTLTCLELETGCVLVSAPGVSAPTADYFTIKVQGKGCHGSMPQEGVDALSAGAHILLALQEISARELSINDSAVLTVGRMQAGNAGNVIADTAVLEGTMRCFDEPLRERLKKRLTEISAKIAAAFRADAETIFTSGCPTLVNDEKLAQFALETLPALLGKDKVISTAALPSSKSGASEDFAYFSHEIPALMLALPAGEKSKGFRYPLHHPKALFDEDVLCLGSAVYAFTAIQWLNQAR